MSDPPIRRPRVPVCGAAARRRRGHDGCGPRRGVASPEYTRRGLLARMRRLAVQRRDLPCAKVTALVAWVRANLRWTSSRELDLDGIVDEVSGNLRSLDRSWRPGTSSPLGFLN